MRFEWILIFTTEILAFSSQIQCIKHCSLYLFGIMSVIFLAQMKSDQMPAEGLALGHYVLTFLQAPPSSQLPELSLIYNIRRDYSISQLADLYFQRLSQLTRQDFNPRVRNVVLSRSRLSRTDYVFEDQDKQMKVRHWITNTVNSQSTTIYVYIFLERSELEFQFVRERSPLGNQGDNLLRLAFYFPDFEHKVGYINDARTENVRECLEAAFPQLEVQLKIRLGRMEDFEVSIKRHGQNIPISLDSLLHSYCRQLQNILINSNTVIELKSKRPHRSSLNSFLSNFTLKFYCKDKKNVGFHANYYIYEHFRCINLCKMINLDYPDSYAICAKLFGKKKFIKNNQPLSLLASLVEQAVRSGKDHLDCYILNEQEYFYSFLEDQQHFIHPISEGSFRENLRFTNNEQSIMSTTRLTSTSLQKKMTLEDDAHQKLPLIVKNSAYFEPFTAYTSNLFFSTLNKRLRQVSPTTLEHPDGPLTFSYIFSKRVEFLPLGNPKNPYFRGTKTRQEYERDDIILYRQIISSTSHREKGVGFLAKLNQQSQAQSQEYKGTLIIFHAISSRFIDAFSYYYNKGCREYEYVFTPYTPFRVISNRQNGKIHELQLEEMPLIRNYNNKHLVWLGEDLQFISNFYNQLRYSSNKTHVNEQYLKIDLLPFGSDQKLQFWLKNFRQIDVQKAKMICIFSLPQDYEQKLSRIKLIQDHIKANSFICLGNSQKVEFSSRCEQVGILQTFLDKILYVEEENSLKYWVIHQSGFGLSSCPSCESYCNIM